jgi:NAD(P)-dependent dehydrogenase (short-subunit alcohol dehydrogenase family)
MQGRLSGRVALISGSSRGIGLAIAQAYAREGAKLCLLATKAPDLTHMASTLQIDEKDLMTAGVDVRDEQACHDIVDQVMVRWGQLDVLVNNAGIYKARPFLEYEPDDFRDLFEVNLMGTVHLTHAALPSMLSRQSGRIINIASSAGKAGSRNQSAYNVSKHAVVGLTRCLALETATRGVTVNAICPGLTQTDMVDTLNTSFANAAGVSAEQMLQSILTRVPMNRLLHVDEIAGMAVYLGSSESSGMTGQAISIDGGMQTA